MYLKVICLSLYFCSSTFCGDAADNKFLQKYKTPPKGYDFLTACKTQGNQYLALYAHCGQGFDVSIKIVMGSLDDASEVSLQDDDISITAILRKIVLLKVVLADSKKQLVYVKKCCDGTSRAMLSDGSFTFEDVRNTDPKIPKEAWLEILP